MTTIKIHNAETGEIIERGMNETELSQLEKDRNDLKKELDKDSDVAATKAALLEKLGISEEEARLLFS